jgi:inorganic triphosphatase YgiF
LTSHETPGKDPTGQDQSAGGPQEALSAASSPEEKPAEVELKLAGQADALEALWRTAIAPQATASDRRLISTYFDTSDLRLRRRGFSLRIRQDGTDFVQTVKSAAKESQSVMRRSEWSAPADGPLPDLRKLEDPQALDKIGLVLAGELKSIFTTDVTRQTKRYRVKGTAGEGALIEAALDTGEIRCDGKQEAICELELELLEGSAVALQQEASRFLRETPLQFQPLSKAERGFALALGERPKGCKAGLPRLRPEASVEEGLEGVLVHCVNHWLANHAAVLDGGDTEGVHQMRVAMRRMRSALTILKDALPPDDRQWLQQEAKFLIGALGSARDWDVFVDELLRPVMDARPQDASLVVLGEAVDEQRRLAYDRARATLRSPRYLSFVLDLGAWLDGRGWRGKGSEASLQRSLIGLASDVLQTRHKQAMKLGRKFDRLPDEALHRLRLSLKKLRYSTEFFTTLYDSERTRDYLTSLRRLQDDLGHLNDVSVAESRLTDLCARAGHEEAGELQMASGVVIGWHSHALARIRPRIAKDWRAFTRAEPFWVGPGRNGD